MTAILETIARRGVVLVAAAGASSVALVALVALAGPASADVPEGWSEPAKVSPLYAVLVLGGVPLLLFVVISLLVLLPGTRRGERLVPGAASHEDQWFGGPRSGTSELAAPDTDESEAGGASARW